MPSAIAVFDIGKTNKKLFLLDRDYQTVFQDSQYFNEIEDDDGDACEDLTAVSQWFKQSYRNVKKYQDYTVRAVNVSAYGASLVHLNSRGRPATPLYNYLKPYPKELSQQFYEAYGGQETFSLETSSPALGMLNTGLQLYWLKHRKPELFASVKRTLHLSQYFAYLLHGKSFNEITNLGCHTGLWNFQHDRSHRWVYEEKLSSLLPPVVPTASYETLSNKGQNILCGVGIHDSSAALVPYLLSNDKSFMLLSTGTWGITLNPFDTEPLTAKELRKDCLQYMSYRGSPVRASRLLVGHEHDHQETRLAVHFNKSQDYHQSVTPDTDILNRLLDQPDAQRRFYPQTMEQTGPRPDYTGPQTDPAVFDSYEEAYHQLVLDLVRLQALSLQLAQGSTTVEKVFISGGFCRNALFVSLLASFFPNIEFYTSQLEEASALGAALVLHRHWNRDRDIDHLFNCQRVRPLSLENQLT